MHKGLTALFATLSIILITLPTHAEEIIETEATAARSIIPSAKITIKEERNNSRKDIYLIAKREFLEESKIVEDIIELAKEGEPSAQYRLGEIYQKGKGVIRSDIVALMWYIVSEQNGHKNAGNSKKIHRTIYG